MRLSKVLIQTMSLSEFRNKYVLSKHVWYLFWISYQILNISRFSKLKFKMIFWEFYNFLLSYVIIILKHYSILEISRNKFKPFGESYYVHIEKLPLSWWRFSLMWRPLLVLNKLSHNARDIHGCDDIFTQWDYRCWCWDYSRTMRPFGVLDKHHYDEEV